MTIDLDFLERIFGDDNVSDYYGSKRIDFPKERVSFLLCRDADLGDCVLRMPTCHLDDSDYRGAPSDYHLTVNFETERDFLESLRKVLKDWQYEMKEYEEETLGILTDEGLMTEADAKRHMWDTGEIASDLSEYFARIDIELRFL